MFTGIIEEKSKVVAMRKIAQDSYQLSIELPSSWQSELGDSIAVNGVCLTVSKFDKNTAVFDVMPETINKTAFKKLRNGDKVNLERALRADARFDGHIVQGHVDEVGIIKTKVKRGNSLDILINASPYFTKQLVNKGSVAIDGISMTVTQAQNGIFGISIIPITAEKTTLGFKKPGDYVNLEADILGKYILNYLKGYK